MQAMRARQPMPDRIKNAPELQDGLFLYLQAFFDLDKERHHGFGPMPIPFTSIIKYAEAFGFDDEQFNTLVHHIRYLDGENLKRISEKQKQST